MSSRDIAPRQSTLGRLVRVAFGGPLLRLPRARSRDGRRLRVAIVASVLFHGALLAGGAMLTAVGNLRAGGTVAAIEMVIDTRGLATGPLADRAYAPARERADRAPDSLPAEQLADDDLPTLAEDTATPEMQPETPALEERPMEDAPTVVAALEPPTMVDEPDAAMRVPDTFQPDVLETPRGLDGALLPAPAPTEAAPDAAPQVPAAPLAADLPPPAEAVEAVPVDPAPPAPLLADTLQAADRPAPPILQPPPRAAVPPPSIAEAPPGQPEAPQVVALTAPAPAPSRPTAVTEPAAPPLLAPLPTPPPAAVEPTLPEPPVTAVQPPATQPVIPALTAPPVSVAEAEPRAVAPDAPTPLDTLIASITPASLDTPAPAPGGDEALPPMLREPELPRSPQPDPDRPTTSVVNAAPPALLLPPEPSPPQPSSTPQPPPEEEAELPIGPVDWTAPFAPPQRDPRLVDPAARTRLAEALDTEISAILSEITCGDLRADAGDDGRLSVRGYVTSMQEQALIRDRLLGIADVRGVADEGVVVIAEGLCDGLVVYSSGGAVVAPDPEPMDHLPVALRRPPIFGMLQGGRETFEQGRFLEVHVETPDFPAHVAIDYFRPDGTVVHLLPNELDPDAYYPEPGQPITIANSEPSGMSVLAGPPFGTGMVVTLSTSAPLFVSLDDRPLEENAQDYLRRLDQLLRDKERDPNFRAQYGYVFVDAVR